MNAFHRIKKVRVTSIMGWTEGEFFALSVIGKHMKEHPKEKGIYVSDMATKLHMAPSAASRMLKNLENKGLIERSVNINDRRNTNVCLTQLGQTQLEKSGKEMETYIIKVMERMGEQEVRQLIHLCNKMADAMETELHPLKKES